MRKILPGTPVRILQCDIYGVAGMDGIYEGPAPDGCHAVRVVAMIGTAKAPEEVVVAAQDVKRVIKRPKLARGGGGR